MRLCGIAGLVLPLSVPSTLLGKGIYFLPMYSSHLSGRNGIYGIHAMENITTDPTKSVHALRVFSVG